jgi:hypothetical protein
METRSGAVICLVDWPKVAMSHSHRILYFADKKNRIV